MDEPEAAGPGRLVVISGPSGVGKGTVVAALCERRPSLRVSVSATTRARRPHEVDGGHYFFLTEEEFDRLVEADGFLEWAEFNGHRYGTPLHAVREALAQGHTVLLEIEVQGALQVRGRVPDAVLVFLMPPDPGELARRLHGRGTESADEITDRLSIADQEMALAQALRGDVFDHVVVNRVVEEAAEEILRILDEPSATPA
jgi:guanylate kinase